MTIIPPATQAPAIPRRCQRDYCGGSVLIVELIDRDARGRRGNRLSCGEEYEQLAPTAQSEYRHQPKARPGPGQHSELSDEELELRASTPQPALTGRCKKDEHWLAETGHHYWRYESNRWSIYCSACKAITNSQRYQRSYARTGGG